MSREALWSRMAGMLPERPSRALGLEDLRQRLVDAGLWKKFAQKYRVRYRAGRFSDADGRIY